MNPWCEQLVDDCMAEHDRVCIDGAECSDREDHTMEAYVTVALRRRVETLQGQVAHAESRIKAVRELHQHGGAMFDERLEDHTHVCASCLEEWPCATIRALDGEQ